MMAGYYCSVDEFRDPITYICHSCIYVCDPARETPQECNKYCPEYVLNDHSSKSTGSTTVPPINGMYTTSHESLPVGIIIGVLITLLIVAMAAVVILLLVLKKRFDCHDICRHPITCSEFHPKSTPTEQLKDHTPTLPRCVPCAKENSTEKVTLTNELSDVLQSANSNVNLRVPLSRRSTRQMALPLLSIKQPRGFNLNADQMRPLLDAIRHVSEAGKAVKPCESIGNEDKSLGIVPRMPNTLVMDVDEDEPIRHQAVPSINSILDEITHRYHWYMGFGMVKKKNNVYTLVIFISNDIETGDACRFLRECIPTRFHNSIRVTPYNSQDVSKSIKHTRMENHQDHTTLSSSYPETNINDNTHSKSHSYMVDNGTLFDCFTSDAECSVMTSVPENLECTTLSLQMGQQAEPSTEDDFPYVFTTHSITHTTNERTLAKQLDTATPSMTSSECTSQRTDPSTVLELSLRSDSISTMLSQNSIFQNSSQLDSNFQRYDCHDIIGGNRVADRIKELPGVIYATFRDTTLHIAVESMTRERRIREEAQQIMEEELHQVFEIKCGERAEFGIT